MLESLNGTNGHVPKLSYRTKGIGLTPLQVALAASSQPGVLSLAMGLPDPSLFPISAIESAARRATQTSDSALQYHLPSELLREKICDYMLRRGIRCTPRSVFLTHGAQQGLSLLSTLLLDTNAALIEECLSYPGFQNMVNIFQPKVLSVRTCASSGIDVDAVEELLLSGLRPAFIYVMPNAHNPLGVTISTDKRLHLARLAREFQIPIIEDDPYGELYYDGNQLAPIRALEEEWVYYVGSFSKILGPSLRFGWIVAPEAHVEALSIIKEGSDLNVGTFSHRLVEEILSGEDIQSHMSMLRDVYRNRCAMMNAALISNMPKDARWEVPSSGVFFWIELPEQIDSSLLLTRCIKEEKVAFLPAQAFSRNKKSNGMRLNFSRVGPDYAAEAVARIGSVLENEIRSPRKES